MSRSYTFNWYVDHNWDACYLCGKLDTDEPENHSMCQDCGYPYCDDCFHTPCHDMCRPERRYHYSDDNCPHWKKNT